MNELSLFNSIFDDVLNATPVTFCYPAATPKVDVVENKDSYTLEMELPGRTENDVSIELDHNNLTIESKVEETKETKETKEDKKAKNKDEAPRWLLKERKVSQFSRRFSLPQDVDAESISANFKNGILTINMQKKATIAPKKIMIAAS